MVIGEGAKYQSRVEESRLLTSYLLFYDAPVAAFQFMSCTDGVLDVQSTRQYA